MKAVEKPSRGDGEKPRRFFSSGVPEMKGRHAILIPLLVAAALAAAPFPLSSSPSPFQQAGGTLRVGPKGLLLYPRWNKAFKPIASLEEGEILSILDDLGSWKKVEAESIGKEGWVYCEVAQETAPGGKLNLPIAASPTTSGLVVKGWSARSYAEGKGADVGKVLEIMDRPLNFTRFERFKREGGLK